MPYCLSFLFVCLFFRNKVGLLISDLCSFFKCVYRYKFLSNTSTLSYKFCTLFCFHSSQRVFSFLLIYFYPHSHFKVFFNFLMLMNFSNLNFSNSLHYSWFLTSFHCGMSTCSVGFHQLDIYRAFFMSWSVIHPRGCPLWTEKCILLLLGLVVYRYLLCLDWSVVSPSSVSFLVFSLSFIHSCSIHCCKQDIIVSNYCLFVLSILLLCQFFPSCIWSSFHVNTYLIVLVVRFILEINKHHKINLMIQISIFKNKIM